MALVTCCDLSVGYDGRRMAEHINFSIEQGDYIWIVGENGIGKSTLMKTLLELYPPIVGQVSLGEGLKANEIGFLPQPSEIQKEFPSTARDVVLSGFMARHKIFPFFSKAERQKAEMEIERLDIVSIANRKYRELSGGQQQRVFLARAICAAKRLLLLDEPVLGLDLNVTAKMYDTIADLNQREKLSVLVVSHDIKSALKYATHILHIEDTQLFFGSTNDYIKSEQGMKFLF